MGRLSLGVPQSVCLASIDLAFPHAGLAVVRLEPRTASPDERPHSYRQCPAAPGGIGAHDGPDNTQRICGRSVCLASVARGIGRLGGRAKGRVEWLLLDAHLVELCP